MTLFIGPIVEGKTEVKSLERLIQRVWNEILFGIERVQILAPLIGRKDLLIHEQKDDLANKIEEVTIRLKEKLARDTADRGMILILLDADDDCPAHLGPRLLSRAQTARPGIDISCVIAKRMFENWIVAGAASLYDISGLPPGLIVPSNPEDLSGSKWLDDQLRKQKRNRKYKKTVDAIEFVKKMDLEECRKNSDSFDKLCRELLVRLIVT